MAAMDRPVQLSCNRPGKHVDCFAIGLSHAVFYIIFRAGMRSIIQKIWNGCKVVIMIMPFILLGSSEVFCKTPADSLLQQVLSLHNRDARMQAYYTICVEKYNDEPQYAQLFAAAFLKENQQQPNDTNTAKAYYLMGDVAMLAGNYEVSLKYCLDGLTIARRRNMYLLQTDLLSDIAGIYLRTNDPARSMECMQEALTIARTHRLPAQEARLMNGLSIRYGVLEQYDMALAIADSALQYARRLRLPKLEENCLENKAIFYGLTGMDEQAIKALQSALVIADTLALPNMKAGLFYQISSQYLAMDRLAESQHYAKLALSHSGEVKDPGFFISLYNQFADIFRKQGDFEQAFAYLKKATTLNDSIFTQNKTAQIQELQTRYDTDLKNKQLAVQRSQIASNKKINFFLWMSSLLLFLVGLLIYLNQRRTQKLNVRISRQREELQSKSEELERMNQVKDRLLTTISHDMRTPVNSLLSFTMLLDQDLPAERLSAYAAELKSSLGYTAGLMENLLNFARSQMFGYHAKIERVDFAAITIDALSLLRPAAQQKQITITNAVRPGTCVMGDEQMMALIIRNLLSNAIKFTAENGAILVSVAEEQPSYLAWQIKDTGIGIDPSLVTAFNASSANEQPLGQMTGTAQEKGTGLGLLLSKNFVALMNGSIRLYSTPGTGSTFIISLPAVRHDHV